MNYKFLIVICDTMKTFLLFFGHFKSLLKGSQFKILSDSSMNKCKYTNLSIFPLASGAKIKDSRKLVPKEYGKNSLDA